MRTRGPIVALAIVAMLAVTLVGLAGVAAAEPAADCAGDGGGALFVADSNFTVAYNDTEPMPANGTFQDERTIRFRNVTLASNASTFLRLENGTGSETCVANVSATNDSILLAPDGAQNVSVIGNVSSLSFGDADYASDDADFAYDAGESWELTLHATGLGSGADVAAVDGSGTTLDAATTDSNGTLALSLPTGSHPVDLREQPSDGGGGGGGGAVGYAPAPGGNDGGSPDFVVASMDIDAAEVAVGESVSVDVEVDNDGDADGEFTGTLTADGTEVDTGSVSINSNWHDTLTLSTSFDEPGTYQLAVDGESTGSVTVTGEPDLAVTEAALGSDAVEPGEPVTITATVENGGSVESELTVPLTVGDQEVDSETVTVASDESETVSFEHSFEDPGEEVVSVAGQEVGTISVSAESASDSGSGDDGGGDDGLPVGLPHLVILGVLGGLGVGGYVLWASEPEP